jgi:hypothetical protein
LHQSLETSSDTLLQDAGKITVGAAVLETTLVNDAVGAAVGTAVGNAVGTFDAI